MLLFSGSLMSTIVGGFFCFFFYVRHCCFFFFFLHPNPLSFIDSSPKTTERCPLHFQKVWAGGNFRPVMYYDKVIAQYKGLMVAYGYTSS